MQFSSKAIKEHLRKVRRTERGQKRWTFLVVRLYLNSAYDKRLFNHEPEVDNIRASRDRLNIQIRHSDLPLALCEQRSNILVNVNAIVTKTALENLKYTNIYNSLLRKKLCYFCEATTGFTTRFVLSKIDHCEASTGFSVMHSSRN